MPIQLTNTKDMAASRMTCLVYGDSGIGKTSLARSLANAGKKVLILNGEQGLLSLAGTNIDVVQRDDGKPLTWTEFQEVYQWIERDKPAYDWLFIDSLTEAAQRLVEVLQKEFPDRSMSMVLWDEFNKRFRSFVKSYRDLPGYSICFTALARTELDEVKRRMIGIEMPSKKMPTILPSLFDEVFAMRAFTDQDNKPFRALQTYNDGMYLVCKDRSGKLEQLEYPDLAAISAKILTPQAAPVA